MRQRMSRSHKSRRGFKVDTILDKLIAKKKHEQNLGVRGFMTLTFLGFYDKRGTCRLTIVFAIFFCVWKALTILGETFRVMMYFLMLWCIIVVEVSQDPVKVETLLLKICHKKRKDVSSPIMQVSAVSIEFKVHNLQKGWSLVRFSIGLTLD